MVNLTPLRNIHLSGGLFTENILLKIRDKKDQIPEVQWITFGEKWQEEKKRYYEVWDWAKRLFGEISGNLESWTIEERFEKWIKPLLQKLGYDSELKPSIDLTILSEEDQDNILNRIQISYQFKNNAKIALHICEDDNFDERNDSNYQKKSQHDHFQRFILLNEGVRWGLLSNGKHIRLLGEYSNIYAKGYVQFNLDSIFINKDESEFWVFFALIHHSRFSETYGLNPDEWIKKLEKKWVKTSENFSKDDTEIKINLISDDILSIYKKILIDFINKADDKGVMAVTTSDSEDFIPNITKRGLNLGEIGRDFYLKEFDSVISDINENLSILQRLQKRSQEEGIEAGKKLRENVKIALELMGEGLINSSKSFTNEILKGNVEIKDFYQELLRVTYRIIFILYAEARNLLPGVATIYYNDLGLTYLRKKAQQLIRDDQNIDLWYRLMLLFKYLDLGEKSLGINAFSGELFNPERIHLILDEKYELSLPNSLLLKIIYELTIVDLGIGLQSIDYSEVGEEEIGSIYEALLDFQPRYIKKDSPAYHFILEEIDTERKGSGTYYTPKGLIDILLKTALKPVVEGKLEGLETKKDKLKALLDLKICDPACGGGSFLLASIDYLGKIHAQIESDQDFPEERVLRDSRRTVLQYCIYGVDLNPMALELAKVSLWLKALVGNKPLTFLDSHLKVGNSLIGFVKKQKIKSIPPNSFNWIKGNENSGIPDESIDFVNKAKIRLKNFAIKEEKKTSLVQTTLFPYHDSEKYSQIALDVFEMNEESLNDLKEKQYCYKKLRKSNSWKNLNLQANLWTSSFFWRMGSSHIKETPTDTIVLKAKQVELTENDTTMREALHLGEKYKFFNWFLEFPEVFQRNNLGFDCVFMNPPWEVLTFKEMEFFAGRSDDVLKTQNKAQRQQKINQLTKSNPDLHNEYLLQYRQMKKKSYYFRKSNFYNLSAKGSMNLYALFIERARDLINRGGKIGCIVQSTILTGSNFSDLFQDLINNNSLEYVFDFTNKLGIFPLHTYQQFSLMTLSFPNNNEHSVLMSFLTWDVDRLKRSLDNYENNIKEDEFSRNLKEGGSLIEFKKKDFSIFNPNSKNSPIFKRWRDFRLVKRAYDKAPILIKKDLERTIIYNLWKLKFKSFFHPSNDSKLFYTYEKLKGLNLQPKNKDYIGGIWLDKDPENKFVPLYGGSSIWYYDHRYNEIQPKKDKSKKRKADFLRVSENQHKNPNYQHIPMYWVKEKDVKKVYPDYWKQNWLIGYRRISSSNLKRTFVIAPFPNYAAVNTLITILFENFRREIICFIANLSSIPLDYIARNKMSATDFSQYIIEQFPVFPPGVYNEQLYNQLAPRVIELVYTTFDMSPFAKDFGIPEDTPPYNWDLNKRHRIQTEIDTIFFMMYGYEYNDIQYILDTFDVLRDKELKKYGEFKTKRLVLEVYDKFNSDPELGPLFRLEGVDLEKLKGEGK